MPRKMLHSMDPSSIATRLVRAVEAWRHNVVVGTLSVSLIIASVPSVACAQQSEKQSAAPTTTPQPPTPNASPSTPLNAPPKKQRFDGWLARSAQ